MEEEWPWCKVDREEDIPRTQEVQECPAEEQRLEQYIARRSSNNTFVRDDAPEQL